MRHGIGLIRTMLECVRQGKPVDVWGDGEAIRDFLFIDDMVDACCHVLKYNADQWRVFNIGGGVGHSINQIKSLVEAVAGAGISVHYHPPRQGDVRRIVLDCSGIHSEFGWHAGTSPNEGIERTWRWLEAQS